MILKQTNFPASQYYPDAFAKKQIVLHHTASGEGTMNDVNWWLTTPEKVATCVLIERDGVINQCYPSRFWAYHLGVKTASNLKLNRESIGIEIDSWGQLTKKGDRFYSYTGEEVPLCKVVFYPEKFRGNQYYEKYTEEQIQAVKELLILWRDKYGIPVKYNPGMFNLNDSAINGTPGVWAHVSYRADKCDIHPQPELIEMLKSLTTPETAQTPNTNGANQSPVA